MYQGSLFDSMCGRSVAVQRDLLRPIQPEERPQVRPDAEGQTVMDLDREECPCCGELAVLTDRGFCSDWCAEERKDGE